MTYKSMDTFLEVLEEGNYVAPAMNTTNLEMTIAIVEAAEETGCPVIVQIAPTNVKLSGYDYISDIVKLASKKYSVPITLHLDHGMNFDDIRAAVDAGFSSVMIDASTLDYEDNIKLTREVVEYCHKRGVCVEAELGELSGKEDDYESDSAERTDASLCQDFVEQTGIDLLAVSIGNIHGIDQTPELDFALLREINEKVSVPLVIHGGSGIEDKALAELKNYGVRKVNLASDLRKEFISAVGKRYEKNTNEYNLISVLMDAKTAVKETAVTKFKALNR